MSPTLPSCHVADLCWLSAPSKTPRPFSAMHLPAHNPLTEFGWRWYLHEQKMSKNIRPSQTGRMDVSGLFFSTTLTGDTNGPVSFHDYILEVGPPETGALGWLFRKNCPNWSLSGCSSSGSYEMFFIIIDTQERTIRVFAPGNPQ